MVDPEEAFVDAGLLASPEPSDVTSSLAEILRVKGDLPEGATGPVFLVERISQLAVKAYFQAQAGVTFSASSGVLLDPFRGERVAEVGTT